MTPPRAAVLLGALLATAPRLLADGGEDAFQFLKMGADARDTALAESAVAAPEGVSSAQDNPAAWSTIQGRELSLQYAAPADGLTYGSVAYGQRARTGVWGLQVHQLRYGTIDGYDQTGAPVGNVAAGDLLMSGGYGRSWLRDWDVGVNLKQARETIAGRSVSVVLGDAGVLYRPADSTFSFGAAARNVGGQASFLSEKVSAVRTVEAGAAWRPMTALLLAARTGKASDEKWASSAGLELWVQNALALRAGFRTGSDLGGGVSLGMGIRVRDMRLDYAFSDNGSSFRAAHRVGISFRFGAPAEGLYQEGLALMEKGRFAEAVLKFKAAMDMDPSHRRAERAFQEAVRKLERERSGT